MASAQQNCPVMLPVQIAGSTVFSSADAVTCSLVGHQARVKGDMVKDTSDTGLHFAVLSCAICAKIQEGFNVLTVPTHDCKVQRRPALHEI